MRLEELRRAVPGLDSKASMVAILTGAREYIDELRARCGEGGAGGAGSGGGHSLVSSMGERLQGRPGIPQLLIHPPAGQPALYSLPYSLPPHIQAQQQQHHHQQHPGNMAPPSTLPPLVRKISTDTDGTTAGDDAGAFRKGRAEVVDSLPPVSAGLEPESSVFAPAQQRSQSPLGPTPQYPNQARPSLLTAVIQDAFYHNRARKDSGLLLPTDVPDTFYYGHRDSMQTLMPVPLPMILDQRSSAYISCIKCSRGVSGLVMIDCDACRKWFHIRCVGIDATSIPVKWSCAECIHREPAALPVPPEQAQQQQ